MRISVVVRRLSLLLAIASPAIVFAQFQPPTSEELKMTAEPMAPGAAAVYLNVEEITDDPHHFHSVYERIKVLEEKGKELATVEIPYLNGNFQVTDIMARTIHSDGTVIPLVVKPEDMLTSKSSDQQINRKVFNLPSVEVGSILEYRYQVRYGDNTFSSPFWEFQKAYFVRRSHYSFTPFKGFLPGERNATNQYLVNARGSKLDTLIWDALLPPGIQVKNDVLGRFLIDLTNTPAKPDEEWMPPIGNTLAHVRFYYKNAANGDYFWQEETKRWSKEVNHFAEASKPMREAVAGLIAPRRQRTRQSEKDIQSRAGSRKHRLFAQEGAGRTEATRIASCQARRGHLDPKKRHKRRHNPALPGHVACRGVNRQRHESGQSRRAHLRPKLPQF